jgi:hypothetical protein
LTDKEKAENEIEELKMKLFETDYKILKIVEGAATLEEMAEAIASAQARTEAETTVRSDVVNEFADENGQTVVNEDIGTALINTLA